MTTSVQPTIEGNTGKFVQLYVLRGDSLLPILGTSSESQIQCGALLTRTLRNQGIDFLADNDNGGFPQVKGENYEAVGMGRYELKNGLFVAYGTSFGYHLDPNKEHFAELQKIIPGFKFRKVR